MDGTHEVSSTVLENWSHPRSCFQAIELKQCWLKSVAGIPSTSLAAKRTLICDSEAQHKASIAGHWYVHSCATILV